jgi:UDP-glucuronate decarboxylase
VDELKNLFFHGKLKSVLITGGTGFFGKAILRFLSDLENKQIYLPRVDILSRDPLLFLKLNPEFEKHKWLNFLQGDICCPLEITGLYDCILHGAADSTNRSNLTLIQRHDQIIVGTKNVLDFALKCQAKRVLYVSSGAIYGKLPIDCSSFSEDMPSILNSLDAGNTYAISKFHAEHLCMLYRNKFGLEIVIARCFAFMGRDLPIDVHFAIGNFVRDALRNKEIIIKGDGSAIRSYLVQEDLAFWLFKILIDGVDGEAYNVGSDKAYSMLELARKVRNVISPSKKIILKGEPQSHERNVYVPSIEKARINLGLDVWTKLESGISQMAQKVAMS